MQKILITVSMLLAAVSAGAEQASLLVYQVWEKGSEPYISRVLVTPDYVRLDEGSGANGYTLFDRQQEILYNVSVDDQAILVMNPTADVPDKQPGLILQEEIKADEKAPAVAGQQPNNVRLLANGEECGHLVVIEGVMQDAIDGLSELKGVLARIQAATLQAMPLEMRTPCDMATNVYESDWTLRFGLPLHERSEGRSQSLVDFSDSFEVDAQTFELPANFSRRSMFSATGV
ncbi:hypothetical protein [Thiosocius teredinicola]|uniref:hypothetical protein n=1 Tax=Thiosocius teredinicola TaxID=1973002 RepID=UPI0009913EF7